MLYAFKSLESYVAGERGPDKNAHMAFTYVTSLSGAKLFDSVKEAINWLERVAYHNGELARCFNGCLRLIRVETVPRKYKEIGPAE